MLMSDEPNLPTGMSLVHRNIGLGLHKRNHEVVSLGWFSRIGGQNNMPWKIYHTSNQYYGQDVFDQVVLQERPQIVLCIGDPWMQHYIANPNVCRTRRLFQWLSYIPVDGTTPNGGLPPTWSNGFYNADCVIAYTEYGKQAILKNCPELTDKIRIIPHGVNTGTFRPLPREEVLNMRRSVGIADDQIVFLMVARNQFRKNIPEFSKAWLKFVANNRHPKAVFWPHMVFTDPMGWNLDEVFDILGIRPTLRYFESIAHSPSNVDLMPEEDLNRLYNICDVHVNCAGEGWGLGTIESMAAGKPNIALDHSGGGEQIRMSNGGLLVKCAPQYVTGKYNTERPYPDENDLLMKMDLLYSRPDLREKLGKAAYDWAQTMTWDSACDMWHNLIMETMYPLRKPQVVLERVV